ncbi:hypothetical protein [Bacteroides timonensis]|uniref:hypothetical protein n=1 Tax=Bacteroides timonensis TaxID=1470345 RepID=UPI0005C490BB|nr:hypothetical protein [Bacteroides timonensis]
MQYLLSIFGTFIVQHIFFDAFPDVPIRQCESLTPFTVVCQILADCEQVCYCPCAVSASVFRLAVVRQHKAFERHFLVRHGVEEQPQFCFYLYLIGLKIIIFITDEYGISVGTGSLSELAIEVNNLRLVN